LPIRQNKILHAVTAEYFLQLDHDSFNPILYATLYAPFNIIKTLLTCLERHCKDYFFAK